MINREIEEKVFLEDCLTTSFSLLRDSRSKSFAHRIAVAGSSTNETTVPRVLENELRRKSKSRASGDAYRATTRSRAASRQGASKRLSAKFRYSLACSHLHARS